VSQSDIFKMTLLISNRVFLWPIDYGWLMGDPVAPKSFRVLMKGIPWSSILATRSIVIRE